MDREQWPDPRINDFVEATRHQLDALGTSVGQVVVHEMKFEALDDTLHDLREMLRETRDLCKNTNGRVTELERVRIADEAVRIAKHGWVRPTLGGGVVALAVTYLPKLLA